MERDYQVFGERQTSKLETCEGKRALAVETMDRHNTFVDELIHDLDPPSFWDRLLHRPPSP